MKEIRHFMEDYKRERTEIKITNGGPAKRGRKSKGKQ